MSWGYLIVGLLVGALLFGGLLAASGTADINQDKVCEQRFGDNWTSQNMSRDLDNATYHVTCENGTVTKNITVDVDAQVNL